METMQEVEKIEWPLKVFPKPVQKRKKKVANDKIWNSVQYCIMWETTVEV